MKSKNKKGFTLIELLAVIVILAIIALIAVPVVMNIITKSRKSAFKDTAYGIIKAGELYYADKLLEPDGMTKDKMFIFPNNTTGLDIKGNKPSDGSIIVTKEGKVAIGITDGKYCITKGFKDSDVTITEDVENCSNPEAPTLSKLATIGTFTKVDGTGASEISEVNECATNKTEGACDPGTEFAIKVNEKDIYRFYVLSDSGEKVTLIMDRNLGDDVAWYADANNSSYGPITALAALQDRTSIWTNLPEITTNKFEDTNGVVKTLAQTFTMYARLPKYSELTTSEIGCTTSEGSCPNWLYINLRNTGDNIDSNGNYKSGYWTSSASSLYSFRAHGVNHDGTVDSGYGDSFVNNGSNDGVRPVIELSK